MDTLYQIYVYLTSAVRNQVIPYINRVKREGITDYEDQLYYEGLAKGYLEMIRLVKSIAEKEGRRDMVSELASLEKLLDDFVRRRIPSPEKWHESTRQPRIVLDFTKHHYVPVPPPGFTLTRRKRKK